MSDRSLIEVTRRNLPWRTVMAGKQLGAAVRQFQRLLDVGTSVGLTDDELLARFVRHRDQASFESLVERHGPMVVSVCRGMLDDPNDAQDAFQATFLVLVRKSSSIRSGTSLGSWLYRVAYNMAIQINTDAARRKRLERRAAEMVIPIERKDAGGADLVPALYEEVNRLPEKYRLPVVLCHLEEMTHAQAARQLGWTEGMVRSRVARAREALRRRLVRRGMALSAPAVALALSERSASAALCAVPPVWLDGTVKAAMAIAAGQTAAAGAVSASAVVLSERMIRSMTMTKLKLTAAAMLCAGGAACVGAALVAAVPQQAAMREDSASSAAGAPAAKVAAGTLGQVDEKTRPVPIAGRVLDPDGRPVAGARLYVTEEPQPDHLTPPAVVRATTDAAGRFSFVIPQSELGPPLRPDAELDHPRVVALADGFGPGFGLEPDASRAYTIRLARDDVPLEGRIVTVEGRPVQGARIRVASVLWSPKEDLAKWREAIRAGGAWYPSRFQFLKSWSSLAVSDLLPATTTGADGRFTLRGIGRERVAGILVEHPSIKTTIEWVVTRRDPTLHMQDFPPGNVSFTKTCYGAQFGHVAEPSRAVVGTVRDKRTGEPLVGAVVRGTRSIGEAYRFVQTITDKDGRYRLTGLETPAKHAPDGRIDEGDHGPGSGRPALLAGRAVDHRAHRGEDADAGFRLDARHLDRGPRGRQSDAAAAPRIRRVLHLQRQSPRLRGERFRWRNSVFACPLPHEPRGYIPPGGAAGPRAPVCQGLPRSLPHGRRCRADQGKEDDDRPRNDLARPRFHHREQLPRPVRDQPAGRCRTGDVRAGA